MAWNERITEAAITTPDDERYIFQYKDVEYSAAKKTSKYQFSETEGTKVQDFGLGERNFPLTIYFSGEDYDTITDAFLKSAELPGACTLEHPRYGIRNVNILSISCRESFIAGANQSEITLQMVEAITEETPISAPLVKSNVAEKKENAFIAGARAFKENFSKTQDKINAVKSRIFAETNKVRAVFNQIKDLPNDLYDEINTVADFITENINELASTPFELAMSFQRLAELPAKVLTREKNILEAYGEIYSNIDLARITKNIISAYESIFNDTLNSNIDTLGVGSENYKNAAKEKQFILSSNLAITGEALLYGRFNSRKEAVENVQKLVKKYRDAQNKLDELQVYTGRIEDRFITDSELSVNLAEAISESSSNLVQLAFSLRQERRIVLDRDRYLIELVYELYGDTRDNVLDFFIESNNLIASEVLKLQKNKEIVYYV